MNLSELIKEIKQGSKAAQRCLFDQLSPIMLQTCRRYVKNEQDAEERMLDGFYRFFKTIDSFQFQGDGGLYNWLRQIMINECLMQLRKKNVFKIVSHEEIPALHFDEDMLDNLSAVEIFNLIVQLPVGYRTVFNLFVVEGMDHKQIALLLDISEGASKSQLFKARRLLQKMLIIKGTEYVIQKFK